MSVLSVYVEKRVTRGIEEIRVYLVLKGTKEILEYKVRLGQLDNKAYLAAQVPKEPKVIKAIRECLARLEKKETQEKTQ